MSNALKSAREAIEFPKIMQAPGNEYGALISGETTASAATPSQRFKAHAESGRQSGSNSIKVKRYGGKNSYNSFGKPPKPGS